MGSGRWDPSDWGSYAKSSGYDTKSTASIYASRGLDSDLNPKGVTRESRDSADNPASTPLIVGLDVTGSMSMVLDAMARTGLNTLVSEVYTRKPIHDPHVMCAGIGDVECDQAPLQVTQFEADLRIAKQLEKIWLESGGGGNRYESYALLWYFAARHTVTDSFEKRKKKGYLFTVGDEEPTGRLVKEDIQEFIGDTLQEDVDLESLLTEVSRKWEVFHVMVGEGNHAKHFEQDVRQGWTKLLGQRAIWLTDHTKLAEVVVSILQLHEGADRDAVVRSWDGSTALVVQEATKGLTKKVSDADELVKMS